MKNTVRNITTFILTFVLMFTFSFSIVQAADKPTGVVYGKVVDVHDGNSFTILTQDNIRYKYKIAGIDTSDNPDAYDYLKGYLKGKNVRVSTQNPSSTMTKAYSYGVVLMGNSSKDDLAYDMLGAGIASIDPNSLPADKKTAYTSFENSAKYAKTGIWKN